MENKLDINMDHNMPSDNNKYLILLILATLLMSLAIAAYTLHVSNKIVLKDYRVGDLKAVENMIDKTRDLTLEEKKVIKNSFLEINWKNAKSEDEKYNAYYDIYSSLRARYNVTSSKFIGEQMKNVEKFLAANWPEYYKSDKKGGAFLDIKN